MKVLVITQHAPMAKAHMAGEKIHSFYLHYIEKYSDAEIKLIGFCDEKDQDKVDQDFKFETNIHVIKNEFFYSTFRKLRRNLKILLQPNDKYARFVDKEHYNYIMKNLYRLKSLGYVPDKIILVWTNVILMVEDIKKVYPNATYCATVHDVNYVGAKRLYDFESNILKKHFRRQQYRILKKREIAAWEKLNHITFLNENDQKIVHSCGIKNKDELIIAPFYTSYHQVERKSIEKRIVFFGAMNRQENYLSVIWFIENVFRKLADSNWKFVIMGGNPPENIKSYASEKIEVTGFVSDERIKNEFSRCKCMVVPLQLGSGIKIKILEAFSAGVPVITNHIGNEGIFAKDREQYINCETAEQYIEYLNRIADMDIEKIGISGKEFVLEKFDMKKSGEKYVRYINQKENG